ncbi:aminoglycoside phosphotransferase family protein [Paenibacillus sp. N4]|uniref:phosphotransferase family protein n=1 Tax=Paenibacillus vietnamensis TaxID=2590547 RepID=UPI001CD1628B|nr:aminoglycoside phosphotransferase family protein [Paenibacillus vietnamensis]MCA0756698.1 aminoglycoside phosphotransferase family protein [Paenibacillus vietnamensis]
MSTLFGHPLPDRILNWMIRSVHPEASVLSVNRLYGGISTSVHSITLQLPESVKEVVLRQFDNAEWLSDEPDLPLHEAASLRLALKTGIPSPEVIAVDATGEACGLPALLMSKLEGSVVLEPANRKDWLDQMAEALVRIHAVDSSGFQWSYFTYNDIPKLQVPDWSPHPKEWQTVIDRVKQPRPPFRPCFIHRDYHPNNVLWHNGRLSGVVDWVNACIGPQGVDIGHCRNNLALLYGVETADAFLSAYRQHAGDSFQYDPYWELVSLIDILFGPPAVYPGWTALGVTGLTDELMAERLDAYMISLMNRL